MGFYGRFVVFSALLMVITIGCSETNKADRTRIGRYGILYENVKTVEEPVTPSEEEQKKKGVAERLDTENLLYTARVVIDKDPKMLEPYKTVVEFAGTEYIIAKEPPLVELAIIPTEPFFFAETPVKSKTKSEVS